MATKKPKKKAPVRAAAASGGAAPSAPGFAAQLRTAGGILVQIQQTPVLKRAAMEWSYRARNRRRWVAEERTRDNQASEARLLLASLGVTQEHLALLAKEPIVEVSIPFVPDDWGARALPWELLLSAATREQRAMPSPGQRSVSGPSVRQLSVVRHLDRGKNGPRRADSTKLLVVASMPGEIGEQFDFAQERKLARKHLGVRAAGTNVLTSPSVQELREAAAKQKPHVVHLAGVDTHQGAEILGWNDEQEDGMILAAAPGAQAPAAAVGASELARAITAGASKPELVVFNLYNSARTAALTIAGGARLALGFQDTFDDLAAELFLGDFYRSWHQTGGDALVAFQAGWQALEDFPRSLTGTGIVLWSAASLLDNQVLDNVMSQAKKQHEQCSLARSQAAVLRDADHAKASISIDCRPRERLNYALLHNRRPMFDSFMLRKSPELEGRVDDLKLNVELVTGESASILYRTTLSLDDSGLDLRDKVFIPLTSTLQRSLIESIETGLQVSVSAGEHRLTDVTHRVTLLPLNEWVDDDDNRRFLPSFVWPLDPAIRTIVTASQGYLRALADNPSAGFDGYQSIDPEADDPTLGVDHQVAALWRGLLDLNLGYINPPPSYTALSQRLRTPTSIVEGGRGTCIDLALLLAAALEYVEIYPVVILLNGHAFPGYWRSEEAWSDFVNLKGELAGSMVDPSDVAEAAAMSLGDSVWMFPRRGNPKTLRKVHRMVRRQVEDGHLVPLESVWLTNHSSFQEAKDDGWDNLAQASEFCTLVDVRRARDASPPVTPLPLTGVLR